MNKPLTKILIADDIDVAPAKLLPKKKFLITIKKNIPNGEIIKKFPGYDILVIRSTRKIDRRFIDASPFKIIATCSRGTDHIDCEYAAVKKIKIINSGKGNSVSAAEHTLGMIIAASKNFIISDKLTRSGKFTDYSFERTELSSKTIGIVGYGNVGSIVGKYCKALGMNIIANDINKKIPKAHPSVRFRSISYLLKHSDIISIHIPFTPSNHNFFDKEKLSLLRANTILINTSRGDVIDEGHVIKLLKTGKIRFAAFDVFKNEPRIDPAFYALKNVLLTNHSAGKTLESRRKMAEEIFQKIKNLPS